MQPDSTTDRPGMYGRPAAAGTVRHFGDTPFQHILDAARWLAEALRDAPEPRRVELAGEKRIALVTFATVDEVVEVARLAGADRPVRLPLDPHLLQTVVQAEVARHGWVFVFRTIDTEPNGAGA